jgi:hypothetical protein
MQESLNLGYICKKKTMRRTHFLLYVLFLLPAVLLSQQDPKASQNPFYAVQEKVAGAGQVTIKQSEAIEQLMLLNIQLNKNTSGVLGYRIQIYSGSGAKARQEAQNVRGRFISVFPTEQITIEYLEPFWNVRVGYFRHKHESLTLLRKVKESFPNSYSVRDASIRPELFD